MARYEGMDRILQGLHERMRSATSATPPPSMLKPDAHVRPGSDEYGRAVETVLLVLRDTEKLRDFLITYGTQGLSFDERGDLGALLEQVHEEVENCRAALGRVPAID